jgi:hypothetical protein
MLFTPSRCALCCPSTLCRFLTNAQQVHKAGFTWKALPVFVECNGTSQTKTGEACRRRRYERLPHLLEWSATKSAWFGSDGTRQQRKGVTRERKHLSDRMSQQMVKGGGGTGMRFAMAG